MGEAHPYIVEIKNVMKEFPGVVALNDISLSVKRGEVFALLGENGAGKSTVMKVLAGIYPPDGGEIFFNGTPFKPKNPTDAIIKGISMIPQELDLIPDLTVADNIYTGNELSFTVLGILQKRQMIDKTREFFKSMNLVIDPNAMVRDLSVAQMQMVAIMKATAFNADVIIMDEPTSAISTRETEQLFNVIESLKALNKAIIYISHKLEEVFRISDRIAVMRDGCLVDVRATSEMTHDKLVQLMVGRELKDMYVKDEPVTGDFDKETIMLKVDGLTRNGEFKDISFNVKKGEILGVSGLMGAKRTEIMETVFGLRKPDLGTIEVMGKPLRIKRPSIAIQHGIAFISEDRKLFGLNLVDTVKVNITLAYLKLVLKANLLLDFSKEREIADRLIDKLRIKVSSRDMLVNNLSGGNQQKVVIAKWLMGDPKILIMDEPTRGIDVGAKAEIYRIMDSLAKQGKAIILISSEMPELLGMSDRIIAVHEGRITGEFLSKDCDQEKLMACAVGGTK